MADTKTVCRVCGHDRESRHYFGDSLCYQHGTMHAPCRDCDCCTYPPPVTIKPCETCRGSRQVRAAVHNSDGTLNYRGPCPDCTTLDGKPSPFPGWRIA